MQAKSRSSLFFIELIICILFFIIASAICCQAFVGAHTLSMDSIAINQAILQTENISARFYTHPEDFSYTKESYEGLDEGDEDTLLIYFDKEWNMVTYADNPTYQIECDYHLEGEMATIDINVSETTDKSIYQISLDKHIPVTVNK